MPGRDGNVNRHLREGDLDETIDEAQSADDAYLVRRLTFIKNLYRGDSITEAAKRVGVTQPTGSRWVEAWNTDGIAGLEPDFGGGRPPKLDETQRERLGELLARHQPLTTRQIECLIEEGFGVTYSQRHLSRLLNDLGMNHSVPRPEEPDRPDDAEDILEENLQDALDELDDDVVKDGGFVLGFLDEAWPKPTDNGRRL